jgi:acyl carrier protein
LILILCQIQKETGLFNDNYNKPKNETEIELVKIWSELFVINEKELSINTSFFDLGGHSIKAILLLGKIYKTFGVKLALKELFNNPTIEELSSFLKSSLQQEYYSNIPIVKPQDDYLVSSSQRRLWVLSKFEGANQAYNIPKISRLVGIINEDAFIKSYHKLLERHEVLRSVFTEDKEGTPRQLILPSTDDRFLFY